MTTQAGFAIEPDAIYTAEELRDRIPKLTSEKLAGWIKGWRFEGKGDTRKVVRFREALRHFRDGDTTVFFGRWVLRFIRINARLLRNDDEQQGEEQQGGDQ